VRAQIQGRAREAKMQELTLEQLRDLGPSTRVYKAVGKMYVYAGSNLIQVSPAEL